MLSEYLDMRSFRVLIAILHEGRGTRVLIAILHEGRGPREYPTDNLHVHIQEETVAPFFLGSRYPRWLLGLWYP